MQAALMVPTPATFPVGDSAELPVGWYNGTQVGDDLPAQYDNMLPLAGRQRRAGILLHPTSLPGRYGIGELGHETFKAIDWMVSAGLQLWQMLPIGPPDSFHSPYSGTDANTGNPLLISIDELINEGFLDSSDAPLIIEVAAVNFERVSAVKGPLLKKAAARLLHDARFCALREELATWRSSSAWLDASSMFDVARHQDGLITSAWWDWPEGLRHRHPAAILHFKEQFASEIDEFVAIQFFFERQWRSVKAYANARDIKVVGDMPIYIGAHSADVWAHPDLFHLDCTGAPAMVSGVPPDSFSDDGQKWGSPVFRWPAHKAEGYRWWVQRVRRALALYDETRIDHFRGFAGYWSVRADAPNAMKGTWKKGPGKDLFDVLKAQCWPAGEAPILAEDLGVITEDVTELRDFVGSPGMVIMQFAWTGGGTNAHLPHNHAINCFCYPGTHDNETTAGWMKDSVTEEEKLVMKAYMNSDLLDVPWDLIRLSYQSPAYTTVIMMQDILRLDNSARMNHPGTVHGNWTWRVNNAHVWDSLKTEAKDLRNLAGMCNRRLLPPGERIKKC